MERVSSDQVVSLLLAFGRHLEASELVVDSRELRQVKRKKGRESESGKRGLLTEGSLSRIDHSARLH